MADDINVVDGQHIVYRGKPLIRDGNTFCYGTMSDKYVLFLMVLSNKTIKDAEGKDVEIPDKIIVQVVKTDTSLPPHLRVEKQFERTGLYDALDIGMVWLERLNVK